MVDLLKNYTNGRVKGVSILDIAPLVAGIVDPEEGVSMADSDWSRVPIWALHQSTGNMELGTGNK